MSALIPPGISGGGVRAISVVGLGEIEPEVIESLASAAPSVELIESGLPPDADLTAHPAALNRAIDAASSNWIFILRAREIAEPDLVQEIGAAITDTSPAAWGFRIVSKPLYCGRPLVLGGNKGEIRFFNRRRSRFDLRFPGREIKVQGPVIRFRSSLKRISFATADEHRRHLMGTGIPHSFLRRMLIFLHSAFVTRAWRSMNTLRYLWIEAGWDKDEKGSSQESGASSQE